jgi:hypothetical protein
MLKRISKMTSLLVCAASIISIVPAMAADVKKVDSQDGIVYAAKAKGAGIYIDGEINGKDEAEYFMTPDGKYNSIDGIDAGLAVDDLLLNQYLVMDDNDTVADIKDNYKIVDGKKRSDLQDDVATTLRKKIKNDNDGRFSDSDKQFTTTNKFLDGGSGLSAYTYTLKTPFNIGATSIKTTDTVYVDYAGNYVDADYNLGNMRVGTTTSSSVYIKNTKDTYEIKDNIGTGDHELKAVISNSSYITVSSDVVYRWANLSIFEKDKGADDSTYTNVTDTILFGGKGTLFTSGSGLNKSVAVLQQFTKATATDDIDGIKYPKDSTVYFCAKYDSKSSTNGGVSDKLVLGKSVADASSKTSHTISAAKMTGDTTGFVSAALDTSTAGSHKLYAETVKLKSENGFNHLDISDSDSIDVPDNYAIQTGSGTLWGLDSGYVKQWDKSNDNFAKVYKVDGGLNNISVGNKDIMILWNEDDKNYSIINNTSKTGTTASTATTNAGTAATTTAATATAGWVKAADGTWTYNKTDGTKAIGWLKDGTAWYYFKTDGVMSTGWIKDGGNWYYLNASGAMQTGWINDNGTWYYCNASGVMQANTTVDGYVLGASGAWIK